MALAERKVLLVLRQIIFHACLTRDAVAREAKKAAHHHCNFVNYPCKTSHLLSPYSRNTQSHIRTAKNLHFLHAPSSIHIYAAAMMFFSFVVVSSRSSLPSFARKYYSQVTRRITTLTTTGLFCIHNVLQCFG